MSKINLSPRQQDIVSYDDGAILVLASAGSGKTRVITERIKRLLSKTKRKILAITFTNKAGEEMRERLEDLEDIEKRLFIGTFHSFCQLVLENHGNVIGFANIPNIFEDESDRLQLIERAIKDTPSYYSEYSRQDSKQKRNFQYRALNFISEVKRKLLTEEQLFNESNDEDLVLLYKTYQDILTSQNAIDFDDLILLVRNLFVENPKITALYRRTYEYICVDEAQDLNYAQYQLLRSITIDEHKNVMMVGDPNQSIFAFNGSSPEYMTKYFVEDYNPKTFELKENYRSSKSVLQAAEKIIPNSCDIKDMVIEGIFEVHKMSDEESEAAWITDKIKELIKFGKHEAIEGMITYEKIAILARNKYVFNHLTALFEKEGIPYFYKITPGAIKFESDLMKAFDIAFRVKLNPKDTLHWNRLLALLNNPKAKNLQELIEVINNQEYINILNTVINLRDDGSNFRLLLNRLFKAIEESNYIQDDNDKKMVLNDIKELQEHWHMYDKKTERRSLQQFRNTMSLGKTHPLAQKNGVTLSTVHTMKGQEYDIVFLMGMDDETFPDYRAIKSGGAEMVQEKNNVYVAFTRSKRFLYVTWPAKREMPWGDYKYRNISRFLRGLE